MSLPRSYEPLLARSEKPGRYVGGEMNAVVKDPRRLRATIALAFPDLYDLGMSYHGFRILYERVNARPDFPRPRTGEPQIVNEIIQILMVDRIGDGRSQEGIGQIRSAENPAAVSPALNCLKGLGRVDHHVGALSMAAVGKQDHNE